MWTFVLAFCFEWAVLRLYYFCAAPDDCWIAALKPCPAMLFLLQVSLIHLPLPAIPISFRHWVESRMRQFPKQFEAPLAKSNRNWERLQ